MNGEALKPFSERERGVNKLTHTRLTNGLFYIYPAMQIRQLFAGIYCKSKKIKLNLQS